MSRDFRIQILLPMDAFDSNAVYDGVPDDRLLRCYDREEDAYHKKLSVTTNYVASKDLQAYIRKTYGITDFSCYSMHSIGRSGYEYTFANNRTVRISSEEYDALQADHTDTHIYCLCAADIYPEVFSYDMIDRLFRNPRVINDDLIQEATELLLSEDTDWEKYFENDWEHSLRSIGTLIAAKALAAQLHGVAVALYE